LEFVLGTLMLAELETITDGEIPVKVLLREGLLDLIADDEKELEAQVVTELLSEMLLEGVTETEGQAELDKEFPDALPTGDEDTLTVELTLDDMSGLAETVLDAVLVVNTETEGKLEIDTMALCVRDTELLEEGVVVGVYE
jgi:hypothetical protein